MVAVTLGALALLLALPVPRSQEVDPPEIDAAEFASWIDGARAAFRTPGVSVALVGPEGATFLHASGIRDLAKNPVTPDTLFAIGSHTKTFTTTLYALLADELELTWDDPVVEHYPPFRLQDEAATGFCTVRDLACHRTGLGRTTNLWYGVQTTREDLVAGLAGISASAPFGETWQYNNVQFAALGLVIESVGGARWEELVRQRFLEPLGMTRTRFEVRDATLEDVSRGFAVQGSTLVEVPRRDLDSIGPAGSIESSARDLARWIAFHLNHGEHGDVQLVSAPALGELYEEQIEIQLTGVNAPYAMAYPTADRVAYGLGWFLLERDGLVVVEHGGGIDGFSSVVGFVPALRTGYVVLQNTESQDSVLSMAIREHLLDLLTGTERGDWGPGDMGLRGQTLNLSEDPAG